MVLWIEGMLVFIFIGFAELWGTEKERKMQVVNICLQQDSLKQYSIEN